MQVYGVGRAWRKGRDWKKPPLQNPGLGSFRGLFPRLERERRSVPRRALAFMRLGARSGAWGPGVASGQPEGTVTSAAALGTGAWRE